MTESKRVATTPAEALMVVALCFGWPIVLSARVVLVGYQVELHGFSDAGALATVIYEILLSLAAWALLRRRGYDVASLVPRPTWIDTGVGLGVWALGWLGGMLAVAPFGTNFAEQPIGRIMQASTISPPAVVLVAIVNGTFEEVFLLGFLMRGLQGRGLSVALGVMMLVRMSYHLYQGPLGAAYMLGFGLVFGLFYARTQRLWPVVFAHMLWDIVPFM
jgi:uncharacterized protein